MTIAEEDPDIVYRPQPGPQQEFHNRKEDVVGYGGAKGPGKTTALIGESLRQIDHPAYVGKIFRRTFPQLQEIIDRAHKMFPRFGGTWNAQEHRYSFPSGAKIQFCHAQTERDVENYHGQEMHFFGVDQVEQWTEYMVNYLMANVRSSAPGIRTYSRFTFNAGGIGHRWVHNWFYKDKVPGQTYELVFNLRDGLQVTRTSAFIKGLVYDNKILLKENPLYLANLAGLPPKLRRAFLDGDMSILEGQYFEEWGTQHVCEPFVIPADWRIYMGLDWGFDAPLICQWWAVPPSIDHVYCMKEYKAEKRLTKDAAQDIHEISKGLFGPDYIQRHKIHTAFIDPSVFGDKHGSGKTIAQEFIDVWKDGDQRLMLYPADNSRIQGWNVFRRMLAQTSDGKPFAQWVRTCQYSIDTIPTLVYDSVRPEDLDSDGDDHAADAARYFFIMRFGGNKLPEEKPYAHLAIKDPASFREWEALEKRRKAEKGGDTGARSGWLSNMGL